MFILSIKKNFYIKLIRFNQPIGFLLLLWPTLCSLCLSNMHFPSWHLLVIFLLGTFFTRSAGCVINDILDKNLDKHVYRTKSRPLTSGKIKSKDAIFLFLVFILILFVLVLTLNIICIFLSFIALIFFSIYPLMKRYTYLPQVFLGFTFNFCILISWTAITEQISADCWLFFIAHVFWTIAYDTQYAMMDYKDDIKVGIKSIAILFGKYTKKFIFVFQICYLTLLIIFGIKKNLNQAFWISIFIIIKLFFHQFQLMSNSKFYLEAFRNNNYVGLILFFGVVFNIYPISNFI